MVALTLITTVSIAILLCAIMILFIYLRGFMYARSFVENFDRSEFGEAQLTVFRKGKKYLILEKNIDGKTSCTEGEDFRQDFSEKNIKENDINKYLDHIDERIFRFGDKFWLRGTEIRN